MKFKIIEFKGVKFARYIGEKYSLVTTQDAIDLMMDSIYSGADNIMVEKEHLTREFFDLKTKIAGDILQKFSTYNAKLAIIGDFSNVESKSLRDFIRESNKGSRIVFVSSEEEGSKLLK